MGFLDRRTLNILVTILVFALGLVTIYVARAIIIIFAFSILFAYLINPVVRFLQRHSLFFKDLRGPHIVEAYLAFLILAALIVYGLAPDLRNNSGRFLKQIPTITGTVSIGDIVNNLGSKLGWTEEQTLHARTLLQGHRSDIHSLVEAAERFASTAIGGIFVIPILAIFFLSEGEHLANQIIHFVTTKENYRMIRSLADELNVTLQRYIRAKVTLAGLSLAYSSAAMLLLRFPDAMALGILAGILEFIPVAGWTIAAATIITIGMLTHSHWIWMLALLSLWRVLMDYWIAPRVMGRELEIHPLLAILTMMVGGALGGIVGIYLSVPLVAVLRVVWRRLGSHAELMSGLTPVMIAAADEDLEPEAS
jgi:predicted PurR-regulated permease PerM